MKLQFLISVLPQDIIFQPNNVNNQSQLININDLINYNNYVLTLVRICAIVIGMRGGRRRSSEGLRALEVSRQSGAAGWMLWRGGGRAQCQRTRAGAGARGGVSGCGTPVKTSKNNCEFVQDAIQCRQHEIRGYVCTYVE